MRDLTKEELKFAPDWATHYSVNTSSNWISVCFFNERRAVNLIDGKIGGVYFNEFGIEDGDREIVRVKPFDITKHEWSDCDIQREIESGYIRFKSQSECDEFVVEKDDAVAMALHFGVTAEDLK